MNQTLPCPNDWSELDKGVLLEMQAELKVFSPFGYHSPLLRRLQVQSVGVNTEDYENLTLNVSMVTTLRIHLHNSMVPLIGTF